MTNEQMRDLCCAMLNCGPLDLQVFDDCKYDFRDLIDECKEHFEDVTFGGLFAVMVDKGLADLKEAIEEKTLQMKEEGEYPEELEDVTLDPYNDVEYFCNYLDSHVYFNDSDKEELYRKYFSEELEQFEENTGLYL